MATGAGPVKHRPVIRHPREITATFAPLVAARLRIPRTDTPMSFISTPSCWINPKNFDQMRFIMPTNA